MEKVRRRIHTKRRQREKASSGASYKRTRRGGLSIQYTIDRTRSYFEAKLSTGEIVKSNGRAGLHKAVAQRLHDLDLLKDIPNFETYFENAICEALPASRAACECKFLDENGPEDLLKRRVLRLDDVIRGITTLKNWVLGGLKLVPIEEAERRAQICARCPLNMDAAWACASCSGIITRVGEVIGSRTTKVDHLLHVCGVCACHNRASVHIPLEAQEREGLEFPAHCWKALG